MIVVDTCAVVDALILDDAAELRTVMADEDLHAPVLLDIEFVSALRGMVLRGRLGVDRARDALTDFEDLPVTRWPAGDGVRRRVLHLRDVASAYDAAYVVLAEALDCPLLTRDRRLARSAGHLVRITVR